MTKSLWDILSEEIKEEIDSEIIQELYKSLWNTDMNRKKQYAQMDKLIKKGNAIKEHLGNAGLTSQFDEVQDIVQEVYEMKQRCITSEITLTSVQMIRLNDLWKDLKENYPNIN